MLTVGFMELYCHLCLRYNLLPMCPVWTLKNMARPEGVEPPTAWFVARYSIQLSYGRIQERRDFMDGSLTCQALTGIFYYAPYENFIKR